MTVSDAQKLQSKHADKNSFVRTARVMRLSVVTNAAANAARPIATNMSNRFERRKADSGGLKLSGNPFGHWRYDAHRFNEYLRQQNATPRRKRPGRRALRYMRVTSVQET